MDGKAKKGVKTREIKRREKHKISAIDAIQQVYNYSSDRKTRELLEKAIREVLKL